MAKNTIADVAREAGVSTMTVSRVLNGRGEITEETRERVQGVIDRLNYRPSSVARGFKTQRTHTLGLIIPDITNPFFPELVRAVDDSALEEGFAVILCNTVRNADRERKALRLLEDMRVDGLILCSSGLPDHALIPLLRQHPAVAVFERTLDKAIGGSVCIDEVYGAVSATNHLFDIGCRRLAFLGGPAYYPSSERRRHGFQIALETHGVEPSPACQIVCEPEEGAGFEAAKRLLERQPDVDGIFCYNDLIALGALQACIALGIKVPEQVALVGFDDIRLASFVSPPLTTVRVDKAELGRVMVKAVLDRIRRVPAAAGETLIQPRLIVRQSAPYRNPSDLQARAESHPHANPPRTSSP